MKNFVTLLSATALTLMVSAHSHAGISDEVAFTYNPSASADVTYTSLSKQAKKVCDGELGPLMHHGAAKCMDSYVSEIVGKINRAELTAYHNGRTSETTDVIQLAQLDQGVSEKK